jgi:hypothetical protein
MKGGPLITLVCLAALMSGGGCSTSQMSRIDKNRDLYETWPIEIKQAVLDGKVEPGMNVDMVKVAWGEPTQITSSPAGDEIWVYSSGGDPGSVYYPGTAGGMGYPGGYPGNVGMGGTGIGMGGSGVGIGVATGRGGTAVGTVGGMGIGGTSMGGMGGPIVTRPTPPDIKEVVFRGGIVTRADSGK